MGQKLVKNTKVILTIILIIVIICYLIFLNFFKKNLKWKEKFITTKQILTDDLKSDEEYLQCINENSELQYKSSGQFSDCNNLLRDLSNWKMGPNTNIGFGQLKNACPLSCLTKQPSQCLANRLVGQDSTIDNLRSILAKKGNLKPQQIPSLNINVNTHKDYLNKLYKDKDISGIVSYIYKNNSVNMTNDTYKQVLLERASKSSTTLPKSSRMIIRPTSTPPALISYNPNNSDFKV